MRDELSRGDDMPVEMRAKKPTRLDGMWEPGHADASQSRPCNGPVAHDGLGTETALEPC